MKRDLVREDLDRAKLELEKEDEDLVNDKPSDDVEEETNPFFKKFVIVFLASFMVLLMLSFIYLSAPVYSFILGLAGSSRLDGDEVVFENSVVVSFDNETLDFLQDLYNPLGDEHAVCLLGSVVNNTYVVDDYYVPRVFDSAWNFVSHVPCSVESIIMLHTHPFKRCEPSRTDRNTLSLSQLRNEDMLMLVMCGSNRFSAVI